jgi:hypothetical protein
MVLAHQLLGRDRLPASRNRAPLPHRESNGAREFIAVEPHENASDNEDHAAPNVGPLREAFHDQFRAMFTMMIAPSLSTMRIMVHG